jgi:hypothetical protein
MSDSFERRAFLGALPGMALFAVAGRTPVALGAPPGPESPGPESPGPEFPAQEPAIVREAVVAAHGNLARIKELVTARPALARAGWDWGFGDWETALDGASHMGNRPIAELLIANGARPTIYTAAMLGQLAVVKGLIESTPGVQRNRGPHGISLLAHARAGGTVAADVARYLASLGDADPRYMNLPLGEDEAAILGVYAFGADPSQRLTIAKSGRGGLTIQRAGMIERPLFHQGNLVFNPAGAEAVRIRIEFVERKATKLIVQDGASTVDAARLS